jgi:hypothetical protein
VKFVKSLTTSNKCAVRYLSALCQGDRRTLLGRTLCKIGFNCGVAPSDLSANLVKSSLQYFPVPDDQQWRVPLLMELIDDKMTIVFLLASKFSLPQAIYIVPSIYPIHLKLFHALVNEIKL